MREMAVLLSGRQVCSSQEHAGVRTALAQSDYYAAVTPLFGLGAVLTKKTLPGLEELGRLPTCFANLASYVAQNLHNEPRFRVWQAAAILNYNEKLNDGNKQGSLKYFKGKIARGENLDADILVLQTPNKLAIVACNTRAIATYDSRVEGPVDVFVIETKLPQADSILVP
jgi:hypothetical protein